jgi:hypothetical protein
MPDRHPIRPSGLESLDFMFTILELLTTAPPTCMDAKPLSAYGRLGEFDLLPDSSHSTCISELLKGSYRRRVRSGAVGQKQSFPSCIAETAH